MRLFGLLVTEQAFEERSSGSHLLMMEEVARDDMVSRRKCSTAEMDVIVVVNRGWSRLDR